MVEIIPKQAQTYPLVLRILLYGSVAIFVAVLAALLALWRLEAKTTASLDELSLALSQGKSQEESALEASVFLAKSRLEDFDAIIRERKDALKFFTFLEQATHPKVFFPTASFAVNNQSIKLSGQTESFSTLEQQMAILESQKGIASATLSNIALGARGEVLFQLEIVFPREFFFAQTQ